ncbi:MAG: hypothetical protein WCT01_01250 [Candidatus Shapirobacteria bacterium]
MKNNLIVSVVIALLIGAGGGYLIGKNQANPSRANMGAAFREGRLGIGENFAGQNRNIGFRPITGEIISMDDTSFTVKTDDGSSKIVLVNDKTSYSQTSEVEKDSLKVGEKIGAFGTTNQDGSVSAQNIQINPQFRINTDIPSNPVESQIQK